MMVILFFKKIFTTYMILSLDIGGIIFLNKNLINFAISKKKKKIKIGSLKKFKKRSLPELVLIIGKHLKVIQDIHM